MGAACVYGLIHMTGGAHESHTVRAKYFEVKREGNMETHNLDCVDLDHQFEYVQDFDDVLRVAVLLNGVSKFNVNLKARKNLPINRICDSMKALMKL